MIIIYELYFFMRITNYTNLLYTDFSDWTQFNPKNIIQSADLQVPKVIWFTLVKGESEADGEMRSLAAFTDISRE